MRVKAFNVRGPNSRGEVKNKGKMSSKVVLVFVAQGTLNYSRILFAVLFQTLPSIPSCAVPVGQVRLRKVQVCVCVVILE